MLVAIQGDQSKPGIITYHDLGLNRKNIYIVNYYRYFWTNQSILEENNRLANQTNFLMFPRRIKVEKLGKTVFQERERRRNKTHSLPSCDLNCPKTEA